MGHEVVGTIVQKGKEVDNFSVEDVVAVPFTISCGEFNTLASYVCAF